LEYEARKRKVYLPAGIDWTDAWTDKKFAGGQWLEVDAPLEKIPVSFAPALNCPLISKYNFLSFVRHSPVFVHSRYRMITNNTGEI